MEQEIIKLTQTRFQIRWLDKRFFKQIVTVDFQPLIDVFKLDELYQKYCLVHWQAKPFGLRRWGVYCRSSKQYYGFDYDKIDTNDAPSLPYQRTETKDILPPSAVICYPNVKVTKNNGIIIFS